MLVIEVDLPQMADDLPDLFRIRARRTHPLLRLAHFARGHHLHGLGDLLSIFDTRDLAADFFCACHCPALSPVHSVAKNSVQHFLSAASTSLDRSGLPLMPFSKSA